MPALYRATAAEPWQAVEIVAQKADGTLILREAGKQLAGIWIATLDQVRLPGREFLITEAA
jgi:hypothetical protein